MNSKKNKKTTKNNQLPHWMLRHYPRSKMSHRLVSGGSPHELYDSISLCPRMRLYFLNIGARLKTCANLVKSKSSVHCPFALFTNPDWLTNHCFFFVRTKISYIYNVSPV